MLRTTYAPTLHRRPEIAAISQMFLRSSHVNLRRITCDLQDGWLVLHGVVPTFHLKQLAQETARKAVGCSPLRNDVRVLDPIHGRPSRD